ncbi:hypothetical protein KUTeg_014087 [Tegillarca granosa]|uniref:t-SNARE coiled-coil homology domain-containing protein n=1 Tax=Tegillarca granosa TaxID=220873 RepID=A0ABQ9EVM5_TEGGR|nr:hypothetical protein KUTeg_014087 [Tegillarca granosa]
MIARRRRTNSGSESKQNGYQSHQTGKGAYTSNSPLSSPSKSYPEPEMSCRDRTNEFMSAVKLMQSRHGNGVVSHRQNPALRHRSEFTQIAKKIGRDLANTYAKLEKLTLLAKRKSLFDDKPSKLAVMSNEFKNVLEVRTENLKHQKSRREQFSQSNDLAQSALGSRGSSVLLQDDANHAAGGTGGEVILNMDGDSVDKSKYQQQLQLIDEQDSYIQNRAETMQNIESTIVELGSIFQQLAHLVKEQEEMVQRIDSNVEDTHMNVEAAHSEILKYFQSVTSNRWLMIKIFGVLIIFFIIFVVFMA